ncbi:TraB/GumN family protein [Phenylobacterium sp.]|uniref:TraB/GumN family protein n=1 Tax=Phenylobacterium sp. TaxID=1871053 RepID=UPI002732C53F|nr:TraB/GumN family protein [Phenylobacterium sp.]MDP3661026.1 TraB/GumN family protein [Phenylobacterium sp.]
MVAALLAFAPAAARAEPPIWTVRDHDSEMVLFGSLHVLKPGAQWMTPQLTRALERADDIWFELPVDPGTEFEAARLAAQRGTLPPGQTLTTLLKPDTQARLLRVAENYGVALPLIDRLEPWLAEVVLGSAIFRKAGASVDSGVEKSLNQAAPSVTQRHAFETPAEQIGVFADTPRAEQIASLEETLRSMEERPGEYESLVDAWMDGDVRRLDHEALDPLREATPGVYRSLVVERNIRWLTSLRARMAGSGRTVVVVGVGHLVGPDGLPTRLRALGYSVEGP